MPCWESKKNRYRNAIFTRCSGVVSSVKIQLSISASWKLALAKLHQTEVWADWQLILKVYKSKTEETKNDRLIIQIAPIHNTYIAACPPVLCESLLADEGLAVVAVGGRWLANLSVLCSHDLLLPLKTNIHKKHSELLFCKKHFILSQHEFYPKAP